MDNKKIPKDTSTFIFRILDLPGSYAKNIVCLKDILYNGHIWPYIEKQTGLVVGNVSTMSATLYMHIL